MVLLQHGLEARATFKAVHRQAHQGVAIGGGEPQGVIQAQARFGAAEALGIFEVGGPQFDPGPFVLHQGAPLGREPLQVLQAQGDAADHELPLPIQAFAEGEAAGFGGQFGFDGQAQATGQAAAEAGGQHHTHAHVAELAGGGAYQHKGFSGGELHGLRGGGINPPGNRFKHREGPAHALEKQFARDGDGHFTHLQAPIAHRPDGTGWHAQAGIGFGLQAKAQLPQLFAFGRGEQFEIGPGGGHLAGHRFAPMVGGDGQTLAVFFAEAEAAIALAQGFLPGRQEGVEAVVGRLIARPELAIE